MPKTGVLTRRGLCLLGAVCSAATLTAPAPDASAATYHAFLCRIPYGPAAGQPSAADNVSLPFTGSFVFVESSCAGGGSLYAGMAGDIPHPFGDRAAIKYTTPAGVTISSFAVWRHMRVTKTQPFGAPVTNTEYRPGPPSVEGLCAQSLDGCTGRGNINSPLAAENKIGAGPLAAGVTELEASAACGGGPGGTCPASDDGSRSAEYRMFAADLVLDDPTPPTPAPASGPLLAAGTIAGVQPVVIRASDAQSGVARVQATLDGVPAGEQVVGNQTGNCADLGVTGDGRPSYRTSQPCAATIDTTLNVDTGVVRSGLHTLVISAIDAAGNAATVHSAPILTRQVVSNGKPNGTPAAKDANIVVRFTTTRKRSRRVKIKNRISLRGELKTRAGQPIAGALVQIQAKEQRLRAPTQEIATAVTGPDGKFTAPRLPGGPSRALYAAYTAIGGSPTPDDRSRLSVLVKARVSAKAPKRVRAGRRFRLTGRLLDMPRGGVRVDIQFKRGARWQTTDTVRTNKRGRFSWPYTFRRGSSRGVLRARVYDRALYPFAPGASKPLPVRVIR